MSDTESERDPAPQRLRTETGAMIAYHLSEGKSPTVVFLAGYASDMEGSKALHLEAACRARGQAFLRFDYQGHGRSSGEFADGSIGLWADDARTVIAAVTDGPLILVGSSMGGWIMLLAARALGARVVGLIGIAAAPDFTRDLMWNAFDAAQRATLEDSGELYLASEYTDDPAPVTMRLIADGAEHLQLDAPIPLACPVRLIHGLEDADVPWRTSLRLADALASEDVEIDLVKGAGHRLSEAPDLARFERTLDALIERVSG